MEAKNLSAVVDFLKTNDDPEYKTTTEIVDGVYTTVSNGLKIADIFTGGFYSVVTDKLNPSKHIKKLPNRFDYMHGSREKIALYNYTKYDTANFMIVWASIAYMVQERCQDDEKIDTFDAIQTLLEVPKVYDSERYIEIILPLLTSRDIKNDVISSYKANKLSIINDFKEFKNFVDEEYKYHEKPESEKEDNLRLLTDTPTIPNFIGRKQDLANVEKELTDNSSLLLINGIGGIGKSALASKYYVLHKDEYDFCGYVTVFDDIKEKMSLALKQSLNLQAQTTDESFSEAILKLQNLDGKKLLVLDDVKDVEKQSEVIKTVQGLSTSAWNILLTSREVIEDITLLKLDRLSLEDARELFISHFPTTEIEKVDAILEYLDRHTLFVELTAKSLNKDKKQTLDNLLEMFKDGKLPEIRVGRKESFDDYLNKRFSLDNLDDEQVLVLKKLSLMPSLEIEIKVLDDFFDVKDLSWILEELKDRGWLTSDTRQSYKMHQIVKEFILNSHTPEYEDIEDVVLYVNILLENSADAQIAVDNRANSLYFDSIAVFILNNSMENKDVVPFFGNVANVYSSLGEYEKALPLYGKALKIRKEVLAENHPDTATIYNNLAVLYNSMGEYAKALPLHEKALKIREEVLGENHPDTATSYNNLAELYNFIGEYEKALPLSEKALKISEEVLGENHPDTATSYNNLAELYRSMGEYEKALPLYSKALKIQEIVLDENHPNIATSYNNLALLYHSMGEYEKALPLYEKALPLYEKALKIREKVFGENHPDTATSYNNLAGLYFNIGKYEESSEYMKKAVNIFEEVFQASHPRILTVKENLKFIQQKLK